MPASENSRSSRLILTAGLIALAALVMAVVLLQMMPVDLTIGNLVLRSKRASSYPFPLAGTETGPAESLPSLATEDDATKIRNVIILIGDGMGVGQVSTLSTLLYGPGGGGLALEAAPVVGLARTWAANDLVVDSAAAGTALNTGFATNKAMVNTLPDGRRVKTLFEAARARGMATAVLTTSYLVDATPACFTVHSVHRDHHGQILHEMLDSGTEIMIGGDSHILHHTTDGEDLRTAVKRLERASELGYTLVRTEQELLAADGKILGIFPSRNGGEGAHGPRLELTVSHALSILDRSEQGFFALVESEIHDQAAHNNDISQLMEGAREFDRAVQVALDFAGGRDDTLVVVTADHDTGGVGIVKGPFVDRIAQIRWATDGHTAQWVPVFAFGRGAEAFSGVYDQREMALAFSAVLGLEDFPAIIPPSS